MADKTPFEQEKELSYLMDQFHVSVPDFPTRKTPMDRVSNLLLSEAPNPLQSISTTTTALSLIQVIPVVVAIMCPVLLLLI